MDLRNLKIEDVAAAAGITPLTQPPLRRAQAVTSVDMPDVEAVFAAVEAAKTILNSASVALTNLGMKGEVQDHLRSAWASAYDAHELLRRKVR
jgi:hypothetical protein